jgi:hypothetical protein
LQKQATAEMIKTRTQAMASFCMMDVSEMKGYLYQYGRTSIPVWAIDGKYYCVTSGTQKTAKHRDGMEWEWKEVIDQHINQFGYKIWESE